MLIARAAEILFLVYVPLFYIWGRVWFPRYKQKHNFDWEFRKPSRTFYYDLFDQLEKGETCQL